MTRQRGEDTEGSGSAGRRGGTRALEAAGEVAEAGATFVLDRGFSEFYRSSTAC